jgi:hypothetical protein
MFKFFFRYGVWTIGILVIMFVGVKYYKEPDRTLVNDAERVKQVAMSDAKDFLEDRELFSEYEFCEPADDALFEKNTKGLRFFGEDGFTLYPETYLVKVASKGSLGAVIGVKGKYVSCKARVFSKIINDKSSAGIVCTGLIFSEPIINNASQGGVMQKSYPMKMDMRPIVIFGCLLIGIFWSWIMRIF